MGSLPVTLHQDRTTLPFKTKAQQLVALSSTLVTFHLEPQILPDPFHLC